MNEDGAPLVSHLLELRRRLTYAALSVLVTTAVAFVFHEQVLVLLMEPAQQFVRHSRRETHLHGADRVYIRRS